jgi:hypothetical protein
MMELTDILVLLLIVACFAAFVTSLGWASRPSRRPGRSAKSAAARQRGNYSVSH